MEEPCNLKWQALIKMFKEINRFDKAAKESYQELIELAKQDTDMTPRQTEGIVARCAYQIHLIDNPNEEPFSNMEKEEKRLNLSKEQSNGKK